MVTAQRGSILIGVVGITTMLSIAAASLLLVAANTRNEEDMALRRMKCAYDAESGLMLGVAWLRKKGSDYITESQTWGGNDSLAISLAQPLDNGCSVVIVIKNLAGAAGSPTKTVFSKAVFGSESIRFAWDIGVDPANTDPVTPKLTLNNWRTL